MAMIVSDAAAQVQFAYLLAHRGKYAIIEEMIGWNQNSEPLLIDCCHIPLMPVENFQPFISGER